jgi:hypothetical protein
VFGLLIYLQCVYNKIQSLIYFVQISLQSCPDPSTSTQRVRGSLATSCASDPLARLAVRPARSTSTGALTLDHSLGLICLGLLHEAKVEAHAHIQHNDGYAQPQGFIASRLE